MTIAGLQTWPSAFGAPETLDRLKAAIAAAGLTVFAHVDHAAGAKAAGMALAPTDLILFGNPRAGTPLMAQAPTMGIDLPLKALVWQDADGAIWLGFNAPEWMAARHGLPAALAPALAKMSQLQADLAKRATSEA